MPTIDDFLSQLHPAEIDVVQNTVKTELLQCVRDEKEASISKKASV